MATPTYPAVRRIDSASIQANSSGDKRVKTWLWDDNLALLNAMLERLAQASIAVGGVVVPGTVSQATNTVEVSGRMGITADGKTAVALPSSPVTVHDFAVEADGYYLLCIVPTERTVARSFSDPSTAETIVHTMLDDLGGLAVAFDDSAYPTTPANAVACAQVQVASGAITAFTVVTEVPLPRGSLRASATLDFGSISAGAEAELTVTVTGAVAGDVVSVGPPAAVEAGLSWCAFVSAADTVTLRVRNDTGSAIDPAAAAWSVRVTRGG